MNSSPIILILSLISCVSYVYSELVPFTPCPQTPATKNKTSVCTIHQVDISPCIEAKDNKPCKVAKGKNASIVFDFTPKFSAENLGARVYWATSLLDVPFLDMNSDGCLYTTCPTEANKRYTLKYGLNVREAYPSGNYPIKWRVWNEKNEECCFMYAVKIK